METITVKAQNRNFNTEIILPASKSISNRLLIIRALSHEYFGIDNLSKANDTKLIHQLLEQIKNIDSSNLINNIDCQDAGTVFRFLTALLASVPGKHILNGSARMQERPIGILVDALRMLGAKIEYINNEGFPPLKIEGQKLQSKEIEIQSDVSSQFISALLMIAPNLPQGLQLHLQQKPASVAYIDMTINLLRYFEISVNYNDSHITVAHGAYESKNITIETDWSAAAFWYQAVAFSENGKLLLKGVSLSSIQGDAVLPKIYKHLGVETLETENGVIIQKNGNIENNFNWDFSNYPDLALPVIATCAGLGVIGKFSGLESLKIKESNRVQALMAELTKLGFDFREVDSHEWVLINSCKIEASDFDFSEIIIETHNDHRVAMSFAPFAILGKGIQIENPDVVKKSYPDFWTEFNKLCSI